MADWTNIFDLGECTVKVFANDDEVFSQVMAKGDSATFSDGRGDPADFTAAVSVDGAVSLAADGESTSYNNNRFLVFVAPSYAHDYPARITTAEFSGSTSTAKGVIDYEPGADGIQYDTLDPASPEPLDMSALTGSRLGAGVYAEPSF